MHSITKQSKMDSIMKTISTYTADIPGADKVVSALSDLIDAVPVQELATEFRDMYRMVKEQLKQTASISYSAGALRM